jgi:O-antigen ligase
MRLLLALLILVVMATDVFGLNLGLGPGMSAKNALLDSIALILTIRIVIQRNFKLEIPAIAGAYALMFIYAALSVVVAAVIIQYPHYDLKLSLVTLKTDIMDPALLLLVYFYGSRSVADVKFLTQVLLAAFTVANVLTITNVYGLTDVGSMLYGYNNMYEANRVYGFFGHANETGALIAMFLPAYVAIAMTQTGLVRYGWLGAMMISVVVLIMTGSRGALAGLFLGGGVAAYACRKYLPPAKLLRGGLILTAIGIPIFAVIGARSGGSELIQRIVSQGAAADVGEVSSGRTELWASALGRMMETPMSLISGFGWNVYNSMGFYLVPHNHYILLWFELGLVGLGCYLTVVWTSLRTAFMALRTASVDVQAYLIALIYALAIISVAVFFEQLYKPWYYVWPYVGVTVRLAMLARQRSLVSEPVRRRATYFGKNLPETGN